MNLSEPSLFKKQKRGLRCFLVSIDEKSGTSGLSVVGPRNQILQSPFPFWPVCSLAEQLRGCLSAVSSQPEAAGVGPLTESRETPKRPKET